MLRRKRLRLTDRDIDNLVFVLKRYREGFTTTATMEEETRSLLYRLIDEDYRRQQRHSFRFFGERVLP